MTTVVDETIKDMCVRLEAFQTPRWAIDSILDVELTTRYIVDPCCGLGAIGAVCRERLLDVEEFDIERWADHFPDRQRGEPWIQDFLKWWRPMEMETVIMNPPFSLAEEFVSHAQVLGARKIICFQRQAWRESAGRRLWWEQNAPARVWVCGARAPCWRFDMLGTEKADKGSFPTSYAWYVWERGHKGAEITSAIYPRGK